MSGLDFGSIFDAFFGPALDRAASEADRKGRHLGAQDAAEALVESMAESLLAAASAEATAPSPSPYRASPIKQGRTRRTKADIAEIKSTMVRVLRVEAPMTVRQMFYRLVVLGLIAKTEGEYSQTVTRLLRDLRLDGSIPFDWIADNTRWMRKPETFDSMEDALRETAEHYRRAIWRDLGEYVEVWCEKEALAGVLVEVTEQYDVPLMVTRGYPSISYLYSAAEASARALRAGKSVTIYYLGDYDPSGVDIRRNVEQRLEQFTNQLYPMRSWSEFTFVDLAVTRDQIVDHGLPTRPTKQSDSRAKGFEGESVELDAIPPGDLRTLVRDSIEQHIPEGHLDAIEAAEESERDILTRIAESMEGGEE